MIKLNNIRYNIVSGSTTLRPVDDGIQHLTMMIVAKNKTVDPDIGEISFNFETDIFDDDNFVVRDVTAELFCAEFIDVIGTFEVTETTYHFYGKADIDWNEELGKDVEVDITISKI